MGLNICTLPFRKFLGSRNCGLEPVTPSMGNIEVSRLESLAHAGTSEKVIKTGGDLDDTKKSLVTNTYTVIKEGNTEMVDKKGKQNLIS